MIAEIKHGDEVIALHITTDDLTPGTHPVTDPKNSLQMLMMKRDAGHIFVKHTHELKERATSILQEAVVVTSGVLKVSVCTRSGEDVADVPVRAGECLYIVNGGFKIEVLETATFFEFKNGPHTDDKILL